MSKLTFDPSSVTGYGTTGPDTARRINEELKTSPLSLCYNPNSEKYTVLDSSEFPKEFIQKIFDKQIHESYRPQALDEVDELGNRVVKLVDFPSYQRAIDHDTFGWDSDWTITWT